MKLSPPNQMMSEKSCLRARLGYQNFPLRAHLFKGQQYIVLNLTGQFLSRGLGHHKKIDLCKY